MAHKILTLKNLGIDLDEILSGKEVDIISETDGLSAFSRLLKERFDSLIVPEYAEGLDGIS